MADKRYVTVRADAEGVLKGLYQTITARMMGVAASMRNSGDKGAVMIKVNMELAGNEIIINPAVDAKFVPTAGAQHIAYIDTDTGELLEQQLQLSLKVAGED